jgi:outer membrane protein TolC
MARCTTVARQLVAHVAAPIVLVFFPARADAQALPPVPSNVPAGGESATPAESLRDIARVQGGWTADSAGARAQKTSFDVAAKQASLRAAEARVVTAVVALFPRLPGLASYTRYQNLAQPSLGTLVEPTTPVLANPSPRIFLPENAFHGFWDAGVRVTWAMNDVFGGAAAGAEQQAIAANLRAQGAELRDAILVEVTQAVLARRTADSSIESATAQLRSAEAAYRDRRDLFRFGKGTSVELADAGADLFRARLAAISARIDQRIARVRIDHATGRDIPKQSS